MNFVPVISGGLAASYAAFTLASFLSLLSFSRPKSPPNDATDLSLASCSESLADALAASSAADCGLVPCVGGFILLSRDASGR